MMEKQHNWAGNLAYSAARLHRPETVEQVQALVTSCDRLKVLGSRHSFNSIADTTEDHVSLERMNKVVSIDRERRTVTVGAGIRYGDVGEQLDREGYALHNLASLPHISVAGACATATHGSGVTNGNLATAVVEIEIVTGTGDVVTVTREQHGDEFAGMVVGLGALGVVTHMTLTIEPTYNVRQVVYEHMPVEQLEANFEDVISNAYSVSLFTDWQHPSVNQVWLKSRVTEGAAFAAADAWLGSKLAPSRRNPLVEVDAVNCNEQMGIPGPWYQRLPHFRMDFTPSKGEELQTEYFVSRQDAPAAFRTISDFREALAPLLYISEVRMVAADDLWMSMAYQQDSVGFHFTWKPNWAGVKELLPAIEAKLAPFNARPHWGKLCTMSPEHLQSLYPKLPDFQRLLQRYDPHGKFRNAFLDTYIY